MREWNERRDQILNTHKIFCSGVMDTNINITFPMNTKMIFMLNNCRKGTIFLESDWCSAKIAI